MSTTWDIILIVTAIFIPPLAVYFKNGLHKRFIFAIFLTLCGHIPGILYALWIVATHTQNHYIPRSFSRTSLLPGPGAPNAPIQSPVVSLEVPPPQQPIPISNPRPNYGSNNEIYGSGLTQNAGMNDHKWGGRSSI